MYHTVVIKDEQRFWKRILIVDDEADVLSKNQPELVDKIAHQRMRFMKTENCKMASFLYYYVTKRNIVPCCQC